MTDTSRRMLLNALKLFDLGLLVWAYGIAIVLAVYANPRIPLMQFLSMRIKLSNFFLFAFVLFIWHCIFRLCGMYQSHRLTSRRLEVFDVLKATTLSVLSLLMLSLIIPMHIMSGPFVLIFWVVASAATVCGRLLLRSMLASVRKHGRNLRFMLIVGTNPRAIEFARRIETKPELGYRILGFVDDEWPLLGEFRKSGRKLLCPYAELAEFLRDNVVDEVALYLPLRSFHDQASQVAELCAQHGIILRLDTNLFDVKAARPRAREFDGDYHIATYTGMPEGLPMLVKRMFDVLASSILLLLLSPILAIAALCIKFTSEGPVFFLQERVGLNKRRFKIFKFRTMVPGAERMITELEDRNEVTGPVFKIKNDPRITSVGKFLRRASIDELPQLINVLKGDMSLVGPRPLPVRDYKGFSEDWQRRRLSVRPGITCLWQVHGRSSIGFDQWMRLDIQYLDEWSLWLDLKILARTIPAVLKGSGAA